MVSSRLTHGRDLQPHLARWSKRHLKTRWGGRPKYRDFINAKGGRDAPFRVVLATRRAPPHGVFYEIPITLPLLPSRKPMRRVAPHHREKSEKAVPLAPQITARRSISC